MSDHETGDVGTSLELSVILPTDRLETIATTLAHLGAQARPERLEVVVVTPRWRDPQLEAVRSNGFGAVTVVETEVGDSLPRARAQGVRAASAPVVVFGETHSYPHPGWADALIEAHRGPWGVVGPAITCANPSSRLSWVNLFMAYGEWVAPCRPGPRAMLPGHNSSFKRAALLEQGSKLEELLESDTVLIETLRRAGHALFLESRARTAHVNVSRPRSFMVDTFVAAREYASLRADAFSPARRGLYVAASPMIPAVRFRRILRDVRRAAPRGRGRRRGFLPALAFGLAVSAAGELWGYTLGGGSTRRLRDIELNRLRHIQAEPVLGVPD